MHVGVGHGRTLVVLQTPLAEIPEISMYTQSEQPQVLAGI